MDADGPDNGYPRGGLFEVVTSHAAIWECTERLLFVLAGLFLAVFFCVLPFTALGEVLGSDEPWYFWVGSGMVALAASVLLAWVFFPPPSNRKRGS
jgi:hypothetical protein